jgi:hypothetical protein
MYLLAQLLPTSVHENTMLLLNTYSPRLTSLPAFRQGLHPACANGVCSNEVCSIIAPLPGREAAD